MAVGILILEDQKLGQIVRLGYYGSMEAFSIKKPIKASTRGDFVLPL